ncbi:hypothetical protein J1614_000194 [Plenodomus biglobosus]|nr:hypothetical protein J1614_000194 [Plenodomus biglobosus]
MPSSDPPAGSAVGPPTDIGAIWSTAVLRYEAITNVKIQTFAGPKSVDEIWNDSKEMEKNFSSHRHDRSRIDRFRTMVKNSLAPIEMWGNIVANATKTTFPPSEVIFAATRYLISTASVVSADFDRIEEFFQDLSSYLTQLKVWEHNLPCIPELEEVITEVFTSVLVLCGICTKYVKMKRFVKAFRALAGEDHELKTAFDQFRKTVLKEQNIVRNAVLAGVEHLKLGNSAVHTGVMQTLDVMERIDRKTNDIVIGTDQMHRHLETRVTTLERDKILAWLSSIDFHTKQRDTHSRHCNGTGGWFLDVDEFKQWLNNTHNSTLWCSGIPGAGKSIMTSIAISHIDECTERTDVAIAYVYCDYRDSKLQSGSELISSITRQLVEQTHPIPQEVKTYRDRWAEKKSRPSPEDRVALVKDVALRFSKTYIFVDALDECPERNRDDFLRMLGMLEPFTRLFITSRPHLELQTRFANLTHIEIAASQKDIQIYVESEIRANHRLSLLTAKDTTLKAQIIETISRKAKGMFLVAYLQIARLSETAKPKTVLQSLNSLPSKIYDFYDEALARIDEYPEEDKLLVKKVLAYIYCAKRPLSVEEMCHALSIETGHTELDETAFPVMEIIFSISVGLIRVDEKSNLVTLVHQTLQEYLAKDPSKLLHQPELEMAKTCLTYLSLNICECGPCIDGETLEQRLQDYTFLDYASHNWGYHVTSSQFHEWADLLLDFLRSGEKVASYLQVLHIPRYRIQGWHDRFPKQFSPLHVVAYWGLDCALNMDHVKDVDINSQDSHGTSALQLAAKYGHLGVVRLLIEKGAQVDTRNKRGETALYWAARNGHKLIVELLLAKGADAMIEDSESWTALDWAVIGGYPELVRLLLERCHHVDPEYSGINKALILAAEAGNETTVQMLLDLGAEVDWKDNMGSTALAWAVPEGHEKVIRLLLDNGADVNSRDVYNNTPLHWALPHIEIAKLLLEKGAEVDAKNYQGKTALMWSAYDGHETVLQLLLENKADVTAQDYRNCTALHAAALKGCEAMIKVLLENGSDPNKEDEDGWTPLHVAAVKQDHTIVSILLDKTDHGEQILRRMTMQQKDPGKQALLAYMADKKSEGSTVVSSLGSAVQEEQFERVHALLETGVDIDTVDACGSTVLTIAVYNGRERMVRLLLGQGADVNKPERNGSSALHVASEHGFQAIVQLLVDNGANVNAHIHTWTPLLIAAKNGHEQTVEYLANNGAKIDAEDYYGRRAVHWIAQHGHCQTLQLFIQSGADIHASDHWGRTPLLCAVECRQLAVAKLLLDAGADVESKTRHCATSLHLAAYLGDQEMVKLLLERGASAAATTRRGLRPLHVAILFGREEVVRLLLEKDDGVDMRLEQCGIGHATCDDDVSVKNSWTDYVNWRVGDDDVILGVAVWLEVRVQQQLIGEEEEEAAELPRTWTVQQLAVKGGSRAVQQLLASLQQVSKA